MNKSNKNKHPAKNKKARYFPTTMDCFHFLFFFILCRNFFCMVEGTGFELLSIERRELRQDSRREERSVPPAVRKLRSNDEDCLNSPARREAKKRKNPGLHLHH